MASKDSQIVSVEGHRLAVSNLDKVMYPSTGTTKADVFAYYAQVAHVMIPHTMFRPATRKRWVHGVGTAERPGTVFFQKDLAPGTPTWVPRAEIEHSDGPKTYPLVNNAAVLAWFAQTAALEVHVPQWRFTHDGQRRNPDRIVLDLDPGDGTGLLECAEVARLARAILTGMGLDPVPVTSGSKGVHLYAQLDERQSSDQVSAVARELARALEADHPDLVVSDMKKALRSGKVLVDWSQNNGSKTTIAPYSLRGRLLPTVAAPRTWDELDDPGLRQLDYREVLERVSASGDAMAALDVHVGGAVWTNRGAGAAASADRLSTYRAKRDAAKTPEPVPAEAPEPSAGRSFVIQEHHARALHYDFRLEHDGVLVSWALPKGVPSDSGRNHLAVQTEDHPLEYGSFEGEIPAGEYGGGSVRIWDAGTYDLEKWRDDEVIVTLHGEAGGGLGESTRIALIRTGVKNGKANWLIHRMKSQTTGDWSNARARTRGRGSDDDAGGGGASGAKPRRHEVMLAKAGSLATLDAGTEWSIEMKWDGIRALATLTDGTVTLTTRRGNDVTAQYPELAALAAAVSVASGVFDGEIVAIDATGRPSFGALQSRMNLANPGEISAAMKRQPVRLVLFDVLELDGQDLTRSAYTQRRERLEAVASGDSGVVAVPPVFDGAADAALRTSAELGLEGVVAKEAGSRYEEGRRSGAWVKIKHVATQEVVIGGWRPGAGRRAGGIGSLLMGVPGPGGIRYVGRVGTGFTDAELDRLLRLLGPLEQSTSPFTEVPREDAADARWVRPEVVGEVEFAAWTDGGSLRHPVWRGLRPDKSADAVAREDEGGAVGGELPDTP